MNKINRSTECLAIVDAKKNLRTNQVNKTARSTAKLWLNKSIYIGLNNFNESYMQDKSNFGSNTDITINVAAHNQKEI